MAETLTFPLIVISFCLSRKIKVWDLQAARPPSPSKHVVSARIGGVICGMEVLPCAGRWPPAERPPSPSQESFTVSTAPSAKWTLPLV